MKPSFHLACGLLAFASLFANPWADAQPSGISGITFVGPRAVVFDTAKDSCRLIDIPDAPARAFVDYLGVVHVVSSGSVLWQNLGPTLETVTHSCDVAYYSHHDPNPADFDDNTWLDSFYSIDGQQIVALGHMEYHGWSHPGECAVQGQYDAACWYNADTFHVSNDGGYHFHSFQPPANYILSLPYPYVVNDGPEGYSIDTNILKVGDSYYAMVTDWPWPTNCGGTSNCFVPWGGAPIRASNILDPTSWRGWDGQGFNVTFADPYLGPILDPMDHVYTPVPYMNYVNAINYSATSNLFVATLFDPFNAFYGPPGLYLSTSPDLVNWSQPVLGVTVEQLQLQEPPGNWSYAYFSLLDPNSADANFGTITDTPDLHYVRLDDNHGPYVRVLFRQKIKLTWSNEN